MKIFARIAWPPMSRAKRVLLLLLLVIGVADSCAYNGTAHGRGVAYTTAKRTCFGACIFSGEIRLFKATNRRGTDSGLEAISYPWRSVIYNPSWTSVAYGVEFEDVTKDWSEYNNPLPPPGLPVDIHAVGIPHWPILCLTWIPAILLQTLSWYRLLNQRASPHLCPKCSYDLRAHLSGAAGTNCPECGTTILRSAKP